MSENRSRIRLVLSWALFALLLFACKPDPLAYEPDSVHLGTDGVIYLHSKAEAAIFRFSLAEWRYLSRLNLAPDSLHVAYSAADHVLYVGYADGRLTRVDLATGLTEEPFADLSGGRQTATTRRARWRSTGSPMAGRRWKVDGQRARKRDHLSPRPRRALHGAAQF